MNQAIMTCIPTKGDSWFVQLRTPADHLMDQIILSTTVGAGREETIYRAMKDAGVAEIIEWHKPQMHPNGAHFPRTGGIAKAMQRCCDAISLLCLETTKHHSEI